MSMKALTWAQAQTVGSPTKKLVLLIIADRASDDDWSTFAGQETIAAAAELNIRSVRRALAELEDDGVIERSKRRRPDGYRTSDLIRVNMAWEPSDPVDNHTSPDTESGDTESGDTLSASSDLHSEPHRTQSQVTLCPTSPDSLSDLTGHSDRAENEPSVEPSVEPSENDASELEHKPAPRAPTTDSRHEAERLCNLLADSIAERGNKRPTVTKAWVTDMDRMLRLDQRTPGEVERCIRWLAAARDEPSRFWQPNIRSPSKLRDQFDLMREQARRRSSSRRTTTQDAWDGTRHLAAVTDPNVNPLDAIYGRPTAS